MAANVLHCTPQRQSHGGDDNGGSARIEKPITAFDLIAWKGFMPDELISMTGGGIRQKARWCGWISVFICENMQKKKKKTTKV